MSHKLYYFYRMYVILFKQKRNQYDQSSVNQFAPQLVKLCFISI